MAEKSKKDEAQAQFAKLQKANDAKQAMSEYEAATAAVRANTERLRALRLARDAAEAAAPPPAKPPAKKKTTVKSKAAGATLSGWIKAREASGHKN
jgi:hypothetical protein